MAFEPIGIVGRACVLPGSPSPLALWEQVRAGKDLLGTAPEGRWRLSRTRALGTPQQPTDRTWSDRGGYVTGFDSVFDPSGFALPPEQLVSLDPLFHWLLHVARSALREAGVEGGPRVGAIFGNLSFPSAGMSRFAERVWLGGPLAQALGIAGSDPRNRFTSGLPAHLMARALALGGGAWCLDAACASSLYALKLACDRLHDRQADVMLAGGVSCADDLFIHVGFCALQAMSRTGRSRPFHREADGLVPAEGAGAVVLKRLADAEAAGDRIFGVIRGIGLSNDGRGSGLLAPSEEGQVRAMRSAYEQAGLEPSQISLVECHATGTAVGDRVELRSMQRVFEGARDLPIGSLKSNLGHALAAAGIAGVLKVLGALGAKERPPSLHADAPLEELARSPFRLLPEAEAWPSEGPRRAAVSAFGFGGSNAHVILEEYQARVQPRPARPDAARSHPVELAIVALGAAVGEGRSAADLEAALFGPSVLRNRARTLPLAANATRFPPRDLALALPQQLWTLAAAREALDGLTLPAPERVGVFIGMGCDPEVARYGARWRTAEWAGTLELRGNEWASKAANAFGPALEAAGVLGTLPNLPANRLNFQFGLSGPGFTVSAEELSGIRALQIAARALRAGELDLALVGAADFSCEAVHEAAVSAVGLEGPPGDGAVVLALQRLEDARRQGHPVLALLDDASELPPAFDPAPVQARFGAPHAARGLLHVACAALTLAREKEVGGADRTGPRHLRVEIAALGGQRETVTVAAPPSPPPARRPSLPSGTPMLELTAHPPRVELAPLPAPEADPDAQWVGVAAEPPALGTHRMPAAPKLPPVLEDAAEPPAPVDRAHVTPSTPATPASPGPASARVAAPAAARAAERPAVAPAPQAGAAAPLPGTLLGRLQSQHALLVEAHRQFVESQAMAQSAFLTLRDRMGEQLRQLATQGPARAPIEARLERAITPAVAPAVAQGPSAVAVPAAATEAPPAAALPAVPAEAAPAAASPQAPLSEPAAAAVSPSALTLPAQALPGLKLDRRGLEVHAGGRISEIYGPAFARQDGYSRQVRMPQPPLLLADRLVGLEAEAGSMGKGRLWTETDVAPDAWYLHDGRMPAGILIEAGQADLMLISYLGIDWLNRGERVYRLLGCDLTYHGSLPAPGETLRYEIRVNGHAEQGPVRLFFFNYDCHAAGVPRLSVREGQAGFFTDEELANSMGVLWDPATVEPKPQARLDPPAVECQRGHFGREQLEAFAAGRAEECFGPGFELAATHTRSPRIASGRMLLLEEVAELSPRGGPWGRGYLRAVDRLQPDDWFFQGHFQNDPCMPGTLMFEGCLQAMAFYLASQGFTLDKDGWRFEPVPEETYRLRCRGQATPQSREVVYELFVEELEGGPRPTLWADLLVTVDGRKAFHCRRMGLRLVPGWPLDSLAEARTLVDTRPVASADGFPFGARSLLACAWGRPSEAFGRMYEVFDGPRRVPRLPGPPYLFMSRITRTAGPIGGMQVGSEVEAEYDIPPDAWYFDANGARTMPFCVLLEAALQPCGWLASYVGSALGTDRDLMFRNLDGTGTLHAELTPEMGTLVTRVRLTNISRSAGMIIESFDVQCSAGGQTVYELKTVFGFFPKEALEAQRGLPVPDGEREALAAPSAESVDLRERDPRWFGSGPRLTSPFLQMIHRVSGIWPEGGAAGLGRFRSEYDVDPATWFFKAHFFQDPVQPGSLGLEAMLQLLQFAMLRLGMADGEWARGHFEPIGLGAPLTWKYRGQVRPRNERVTVLLDIVRTAEDERGRTAVADASLWVDGLRIYEAKGMAMRITRPPGPSNQEETLDPAKDGWLGDHRPTFTVPALPMMSMVDRLAAAVARQSGLRVVGLDEVRVHRWVPVTGPLKLRTEVVRRGDAYEATLLAWCEKARAELSRFEPVASARVSVAKAFPTPTEGPWAPPADAHPVEVPYRSGTLFHGPSFQLLRSLSLGSAGASALLDAGAGGAPRGLLHEALLDALTHAIPHDGLSAWSSEIAEDQVAYPSQIRAMRFFGEMPREGEVRCEVRFAGLEGDGRFPRFQLQAISAGRVVASLELVEALFPKGPIGTAEPELRRAFLRDRAFVPGLRLSSPSADATVLEEAAVRASDWLPGTLASAYACQGPDLLPEIAAKEHVASRAAVHPAAVEVDLAAGVARCTTEPLVAWPLTLERQENRVVVNDAGRARLDLEPVRDYWDRYFGVGRWPIEDLYYGLAERFLRRVRFSDPDSLQALRGRGVLYLANHQVGIESLLFSVVLAGLTRIPTVTLAKAEHRTSWLGLLIKHSFSYPGVRDPGVITFFDRQDQGQLPRVVLELAQELQTGGKSVMVHVEGTRSLTCRRPPVQKMSGAFLDMAIQTGTPVVPVRFAGALPVEPLQERIEFPVGMAAQDILVGRPILADELARLTYKERKEQVLGAINALGPREERPHAGDPAFAAAVTEWAQRTGASEEDAVLFVTLCRAASPCEETRALVEAGTTGRYRAGNDARGRWLGELARRLFGERGPRVQAPD